MPRRYITVAEQQQIIARAGRRCEYCKSTIDHTPQSFACEHILPIAEGGETDLENLALSCGGCNGHKHTKTQAIDPISQAIVPLFHPRQQVWREHFTWSLDTLRVIGITATGRATVNALKLNRAGVVNLRKLLIMAGLHPPDEN
ncbi:HNH endonuclease signature motif containing protein [Alkalinema sp. FACHB-956]|uniref:HNH endonuclease n=1 Tax=Alkalinema sp. FACHB-956 TaxID=2692768 RepID=UPI0016895F02|nr:HNH endonuclease signature motif containing protein [Alkalinema sp. FACHB-956]MBD2329272.1 HNH endonuclease [Alkalinema sp. FACHB-956]